MNSRLWLEREALRRKAAVGRYSNQTNLSGLSVVHIKNCQKWHQLITCLQFAMNCSRPRRHTVTHLQVIVLHCIDPNSGWRYIGFTKNGLRYVCSIFLVPGTSYDFIVVRQNVLTRSHIPAHFRTFTMYNSQSFPWSSSASENAPCLGNWTSDGHICNSLTGVLSRQRHHPT